MPSEGVQGDEWATYVPLDTYSRDERGIAYGTRVLWRRRPRSSRGSHAPPRSPGKPDAGRRGPGDRASQRREVRVMRNAETVMDVLRGRVPQYGHWRARCWESWHGGFGPGAAGKGPDGYLASGLPVRRATPGPACMAMQARPGEAAVPVMVSRLTDPVWSPYLWGWVSPTGSAYDTGPLQGASLRQGIRLLVVVRGLGHG